MYIDDDPKQWERLALAVDEYGQVQFLIPQPVGTIEGGPDGWALKVPHLPERAPGDETPEEARIHRYGEWLRSLPQNPLAPPRMKPMRRVS